ncbi:serine dehydratase beta chain [Mycobacteroides abscessus]|uniref:serine dehydratase beta chain n=1 Tax=Mycobacteroides abscessus TaxID=36809 RepID=UPI0022A983AC|nr:serine dehydratase beta chain [Mycobacteroides abscessus]
MFDLFKIGIGPSSSHTVGPMIAAGRFVRRLADAGALGDTRQVVAELFGSLGATGRGHGSDGAVILGLLGERPDTVDTAQVGGLLGEIESSAVLPLLRRHPIEFG